MTEPPRATYRLQLRAGMTFARAASVVPYLAGLGISHLYLSPPFAAVPGSTHGYDVVDPNQLDPELGGETGFMELRRALDEHGLGLILDIVPNHMGIGAANPWWWAVLRHGRGSRWAGHFDIDFAADAHGKLVLPVLAAPLDEVLARGELRLALDGAEPELEVGGQRFPLAPGADLSTPLRRLLETQHYRLVHWREGASRRNYRRFFDVDQLAGLRVDEPEVFEDCHRLVLDLAGRGLIQGLRVDHVDGLTDPKAYLLRLQRRLVEARGDPGPFWVVVEKILIGGETLPEDWPVAGTTGYEFLNEVLGLLVDPSGLQELEGVAERFIGRPQDHPAIVRAAKEEVLDRLFAGELAGLARCAAEACGLGETVARDALRRLLVAFPVYRTYADADGWSARDRAVLARALALAAADAPDRAALDRLGQILTGGDAAALLQGLQQLSGPVMAKAVEDTAFYRHHRLLALNEVGGEADGSGLAPEGFHRRAAERLEHWPDTLLATATHDTKRGEDARARLAVLSEVPAEWEAAVGAWHELHRALPAIDPADEYAFYQSLLGAWPPELPPHDADGVAALGRRLEGWLVKALREGKQRSSWSEPDAAYEARATAFVRAAMSGALPAAVAAFVARIDAAATANGLGQLLVKLTAPGVPDIYQGTELWEGSLVDPDNRRPVDFAALAGQTGAKSDLLRRVLAYRAEQPLLFARGDYRPLAARGALAGHVLAFARVRDGRVALTVITRLLGHALLDSAASALPAQRWADAVLPLPPDWRALAWRDRLAATSIEVGPDGLCLAPLLDRAPVALVSGEPAAASRA